MDIKQKILAAGTQLLHEEGFTALTQTRIAKAADIRQSHLTYYFPARTDLLLALGEHSVDQALNQASQGPGDPLDRLMEGVRYLPRARMLAGLVTAADQDPALRPALDRLINHVRHSIGAFVTQLGYQCTSAQIVALHGMVAGLAVLNLGQQNAKSEADIEDGLKALLASFKPQKR